MKKQVALFIFFVLSIAYFIEAKAISFTENKGQWHKNSLYKSNFRGGSFFAEKNAFTILLFQNDLYEFAHHNFRNSKPIPVNLHSFKIEFLNTNSKSKIEAQLPNNYKRNYFVGADSSKWASNVSDYDKVVYTNFYNGIDLILHSINNNIKYDFKVKPKANAKTINWKINGADKIYLKNNQIFVHTSVGDYLLKTPVSYQINKSGDTSFVACNYVLNQDNTIAFLFPNGYDTSKELIIDPELVFATFTGSVSDNWGFCATYDIFGNAYAGGIAFGANYPTTTGAFQTTFAGGSAGAPPHLAIDISISVFSPDGSTLLYSTLLGGASNEMPLSMVCNRNNELIVFSRSYSQNFPTTSNTYDATFNGVCDLALTRFKRDLSGLIGSTFIGGSAEDGVNVYAEEDTLGFLKYNYGDDARGEVQIDDDNNIYFTSSTKSNDFPVNGFQTTFGGVQDAVVGKFNPSLSNLLWCNFIGGNKFDAGYALFVEKNKDVLLCGGTESKNILTTGTGIEKTYQGGIADGFVVRIDANGTSQKSFSYIGTNSYDQTFFVQQDKNGAVFLLGQTKGSFPVTAGVYNNPNSGIFVQKLNKDLTSVLMSTVVGSGSGAPDIVPSAFSADKCDNIYIAGWGGSLNGFNRNETFSINLPTTANAYQASSDSSDFYFMVLDNDATSLIYATYFGGKTSHEHVDGGTSRFDKEGYIYQAICGGCGGNSDMPTTPSAWSIKNESRNCNNAIVKFEFDLKKTIAEFLIEPLIDEGCAPFKVDFQNYSKSALQYEWNFGDGSKVDSLENTSHNFEKAGEYNVQLIAQNRKSCNVRDTSYRKIIVHPKPDVIAMADTTIRSGDAVKLWAYNDSVYYWYPPYNTSCEKCQVSYAKPDTATTYYVNVFNQYGCTDKDTVNVRMIYTPTLYIPNCFTPNNNGLNEIFKPYFLAMTEINVSIYNRWDELIYVWDELNGGWDGKIDGREAPQGVYIYHLTGVDRNGDKVKQIGSFTLLR